MLSKPSFAVIEEFVSRIGRASLYQRFCPPSSKIPPSYWRMIDSISDDEDCCFGAFNCSALIGTGEIIRSSDGHHLGLLVADPWQGLGVGRRLAQTAVRWGVHNGMKDLVMNVHAQNTKVIGWATRYARSSSFSEGGIRSRFQ
ncbi:GNAT family N-acetyltransferase [Streptomyces cinereoruber]|uniref:GNAT family N-acetyltransferase n=1 Tax=Streptomyces cinereoruber TaxID=67260 RepID=UPI0036439F56